MVLIRICEPLGAARVFLRATVDFSADGDLTCGPERSDQQDQHHLNVFVKPITKLLVLGGGNTQYVRLGSGRPEQADLDLTVHSSSD